MRGKTRCDRHGGKSLGPGRYRWIGRPATIEKKMQRLATQTRKLELQSRLKEYEGRLAKWREECPEAVAELGHDFARLHLGSSMPSDRAAHMAYLCFVLAQLEHWPSGMCSNYLESLRAGTFE
jgi:hypothetical protein